MGNPSRTLRVGNLTDPTTSEGQLAAQVPALLHLEECLKNYEDANGVQFDLGETRRIAVAATLGLPRHGGLSDVIRGHPAMTGRQLPHNGSEPWLQNVVVTGEDSDGTHVEWVAQVCSQASSHMGGPPMWGSPVPCKLGRCRAAAGVEA
jgi:hypothetical protein